MQIKDVLSIDISEDIKNVIDLEDISEAEIQTEIENYIITEGLAKEYAHFVSLFTSNIVETGVWISGFYGSGKSYFGKLLGYMLSNRKIAGTPARDRILQRFTGIADEALITNSLAKLNTESCRVVFLDVAKQNTAKGLAFTLFRNFLKSMELPENEHGFFLYNLMINAKQANIYPFINQNLKLNWGDIKSRPFEYAKAAKTIYMQLGNSESDYNHLLTTFLRDIDQFSASRLKEELENYLQFNKDEKIIFIFDEVSEAINQQKFNLLDLEGVSESLSALGGKVWTIAIAQEKLDEVINNSNMSRAQLTKVTDRFKTKIHLESTEVDVIIRKRLLEKKNGVIKKLKDYYQENSGKITDHAALNAIGITKTDTVDSYITYYPFYNYQFDMLQNFLFGSKGPTSTKIAARGMIITTYDILKRELQYNELFDIATAWQIAKQAQPQLPVRLVNKYDNAEKILKETKSSISGRQLLETINLLSESVIAQATTPNIVKAFIKDPEDFYKVKPEISKALDDLVEAKVLLSTNNIYRITSDIEQGLLDDMNGFAVENYVKKKQLVTTYKSSAFIKTLARIPDNSSPYDFFITTDDEDELTTPPLKHLKLKLKSLYNIKDVRTADIDALKDLHRDDKDLIWLVPDNKSFMEIDKLIDEIMRITYLGDKYNNHKSEEGQILRSFLTDKSEKENRLKELVEQSLQNATSIYLYDTFQLDKDNWQNTLHRLQRQVIQNMYSKSLESQLSDTIAEKVIKEGNNARLQSYFNSYGRDFQFFNSQGNFIGDNLKVVEEIILKIKNTFMLGADLEKVLAQPPTGFNCGTVISTVAALMRAGKIVAKYNGTEKFSWQDEGVNSIFAAPREFRKASFKAIAKSLSAQQKNEIVSALHDLKCEDHINKRIDWNTNDFELANTVKELAKRFCDIVNDMRKQNKNFDLLFAGIETQKETLSGFTGTVSEANYIDKIETFLANKNDYINAVQSIERVEQFVRDNLPKLLKWKMFVDGVNDELIKAAKINKAINPLIDDFNAEYGKEVLNNFVSIQQITQKIKDEYFTLMKGAAADMAGKYIQLKTDAETAVKEINTLPAGLNDEALEKVKAILFYAAQRTQAKVEIDHDVKEKHSRFTYSEILSFIELFNSKKTDLEILKAGLVKVAPPKPEQGKPKPAPSSKIFIAMLPAQKLKVKEYKQWLHQELQKIAGAGDNDEIEINNNLIIKQI